MKKKIKVDGIIIVEGRDDITALKRIVDGHIIALNGFSGMTEKSLMKLEELAKANDLILLTDPDYAGKMIRKRIKQRIPRIKHAFISRENARKKDNIGVENASDDAILEALSHLIEERAEESEVKRNPAFLIEDLLENGLCSGENAKGKRVMLGDILKIGYYNSRQLLNALNSFNITREEFSGAIKEINARLDERKHL